MKEEEYEETDGPGHDPEWDEPQRVTCGCCTNGCVCFHHQDTPNGRPPRTCSYHREPSQERGDFTDPFGED